jgi:dTDP-glucose 4,6-dehydratase
LVRAYHETYGLDTTVTNCSNNYGPYQFPEKLIPLSIINILAGKPLPIYGDGRQLRDWLHVTDHCEAICLALARGQPGAVYNIGGNAETANIDIVQRLCALVDARLAASPALRAAFPESPASCGNPSTQLITHVRDRPGHDRRYAIDYAKAGGELGYAPARDLASGLGATLDWYLSEVRWWRPLLGPGYAQWIATNYDGEQVL